MLILRRGFSRIIHPSRRTARKSSHKKEALYRSNTQNISNPNNINNNQVTRTGGGGFLSTFYESFIYGCGFFLSNRLLDQIFGPRYYDSIQNNFDPSSNETDNANNATGNVPNESNNHLNHTNNSSEHFLKNDSSINDNDFQQDIGLDDDTFEF